MEEKTREMEERTFGCTKKVMGLNGIHMFHMGPVDCQVWCNDSGSGFSGQIYTEAPMTAFDVAISSKLLFIDVLFHTLYGVGVISTPITKKSTDTFYYLTLEGIKVGNKSLTYTMPSKANSVDQGNIIIDSGTTLTLLPNELYEKLESELIKVITGNRTSDPLGLFSLCYSNSIDITKLPTITFKFTGTDRELPLLITFLQNGNGPMCLAFVPTDELPIFGNLSQMNLLIGYDLVKSISNFICINFHYMMYIDIFHLAFSLTSREILFPHPPFPNCPHTSTILEDRGRAHAKVRRCGEWLSS
ncbi:hypothetical protein HYC85_024405 [Camellia sinensis]|uniref:Peptidase A1 domain-containing protein n=1 Tax=Camellia sinensis TaxID=4442 RepID=A0A7J7G831_CAMSI|nr:hypothetical protein HYC85_024405 [Camellia sinensis]